MTNRLTVNEIHFRRMVAATVKQSGICRATVEQVLPAFLDVVRRELAEGARRSVVIESFGTLAVKEVPARQYHYVRKSHGIDTWVDRPPKRVLKFAPTRNVKREIEQGRFDPTRKSFIHHPDDPRIRSPRDLTKRQTGTPWTKVGPTKYFKKKRDKDGE